MGGVEQKAKSEGHNTNVIKRSKMYGISPSTYNFLMETQKGKCMICRNDMIKPCVDHNHVTGKVRALLCPQCNSGLGFFKENIVSLENAIKYLNTFKK